jgi:hypothetical protein
VCQYVILNGHNRKGLRWGISAGALALSSYFWWRMKGHAGIAEEHGPMENVQSISLTLGALMFWVQGWKTSDPGAKRAFALAGLGYFTILVLEFDVRPFKIAWLTLLLSGPIRNMWLAAAWVYVLIRAAKDLRKVIQQGVEWARSVIGPVLALSAAFWIAGAAFEDLKLYSPREDQFMEELMENNAALLMLWAAIEIALDARAKRRQGPIAVQAAPDGRSDLLRE